MRIQAKLAFWCLVAALAVGSIGCKGTPPEPPRDINESTVAQNKAEISIVAFELTTPSFVDVHKQAMRPLKDQSELAVVRLRIKNPTDANIVYKPLHFEAADRSVQLCTDPNPETGERTNVKSVVFDIKSGIHTTNQLVANAVDIPPGGEILDDYLFEHPVIADSKLVVLVPGSVIGQLGTTFRFYVSNPPPKVVPPEPKRVGEANVLDGMSLTVNSVDSVYMELVPRAPSKEALKYAYAFTEKPVLAINVTITNTSSKPLSYQPSHTAEMAGINLQMPGGIALKRVKLDPQSLGKGQVNGVIQLDPEESKQDVYLFELPSSASTLDFSISGHVFGVRGMYQFILDYVESTPEMPNLEPYKEVVPAAADTAALDAAAADLAASNAAALGTVGDEK